MLIFSIKSHLICTQVQSVPLILKPFVSYFVLRSLSSINFLSSVLSATVSV